VFPSGTCGPVGQGSFAQADANVKRRGDELSELVGLADIAARTVADRSEGHRAAQVATELVSGDPSVSVVHLDGTSEAIQLSQLPEYVTEELNPDNSKSVARVILRGRWQLLQGNVVLVDTPGIGSVHEHNTAAAQAALLDADGAIVVLGAGSPLSAAELDMLARLRARKARTFYVVNKVDQLDAGEVSQVKHFIEEVIEEATGRQPRLYFTDARSALRGDNGVDFAALVADLEEFVDTGLTAALIGVAKRDLGSIGSSLRGSVALERAAFDMDQAKLARLSALFGEEASRQRALYHDDLTIARRDVDELVRAARHDLEVLAAAHAKEFHARLHATADKCLQDGDSYEAMAERLRTTIEESVREAFDAARAEVLQDTEAKWRTIAQRLRSNADQRVAAVRSAASDLFAVELPPFEMPPLSEEEDLFSYLFLRVGSSTDLLTGAAARLLPARFAWRRLVLSAEKQLDDEIAKHAGRAGWDLSQRLSSAMSALNSAMTHEIDVTVAEVERAARRADERREASLAEQERTEKEQAVLDDLATRLVSSGCS